MKKMLLVLVMILCICSSAYAKDMYTAIDDEARMATKPFLNILADAFKKQDIAVLSTGARAIVNTKDLVYLCWIETKDGYYYYEVTFKTVNDNKELSEKYGL